MTIHEPNPTEGNTSDKTIVSVAEPRDEDSFWRSAKRGAVGGAVVVSFVLGFMAADDMNWEGPKNGIVYAVGSGCEKFTPQAPYEFDDTKIFSIDVDPGEAIVRFVVRQKELPDNKVDQFIKEHIPHAHAVRSSPSLDPGVVVDVIEVTCSPIGTEPFGSAEPN